MKKQSPINILTHELEEKEVNIAIQLTGDVTNLHRKDHTLSLDPKGTMVINNHHYELINLHFHTPSEHTINHEFTKMEAHFVLQDVNHHHAVVAVMIEEGEENQAFQEIFDLFEHGGTTLPHWEALFPQVKTGYHYEGSLTTPPFTEDIDWYVLNQPITISAAQLAHYQKDYQQTNRRCQPINGRTVYQF